MSIRTTLSLAIAIALIGTSYGQQSGAGSAAPRETQQQISSPADTQQQGPQLNNQDRANAADQRVERTAGFRGTTARGEMGRTARLSEIMDFDVHNAQDEDLGDIEDIVIDTENGEVRYVAVSVGGFLGVGDRLVAVPWKSFRQQKDEDGDTYLVLNVDKARLENAPGFNQENWPDFGDERYSTEIETYYGDDAGANRSSATNDSATNRTNAPATPIRTEPQRQQ